MRSIFSTLFGWRWQRCVFSLSVLQQLVLLLRVRVHSGERKASVWCLSVCPVCENWRAVCLYACVWHVLFASRSPSASGLARQKTKSRSNESDIPFSATPGLHLPRISTDLWIWDFASTAGRCLLFRFCSRFLNGL